eukprot:3515963-Lingulodinium_polyedra.AAC.1
MAMRRLRRHRGVGPTTSCPRRATRRRRAARRALWTRVWRGGRRCRPRPALSSQRRGAVAARGRPRRPWPSCGAAREELSSRGRA